MTQAEALEQAILARAERLASEFRERGKRSGDAILRDAADKLRLREQREESIAKALGDRTFRQQVQAQELKMQTDLDRTRWNLVCNVESRLADQMRKHRENPTSYLATLRQLIEAAVTRIERPLLWVHANAADLRLLGAHWAAIEAAAPDGKKLRLASDPIDIVAGVLVVSDDGRIRVDNSFEGRLARLRARIQQSILEHLLPSGFDTGTIFSG